MNFKCQNSVAQKMKMKTGNVMNLGLAARMFLKGVSVSFQCDCAPPPPQRGTATPDTRSEV